MWYEEIEPFGELRADHRSAQIVAMIHNAAVKQGHERTAESFLLKFEERREKPRQTPEEQVRIIKILAMTLAAGKE